MRKSVFLRRVGVTGSVDETSATELLAEYEDRMLRGDWPDLDEYVHRYRGKDAGNFRVELELAAVLLCAGAEERRRNQDEKTDTFNGLL